MIEYIFNWCLYSLFFYICLPKTYNSITIISNLVSLTHALITIILSLNIILNDEFILDHYNYDKMWIIKISSAYFIYDCLFMLLNNFSMMFFLHHLLILAVYYITISNDYGTKLVIYTLFWGEITNPLQISWFLSRYLNYKKIETYIFPVFSFNFILVRSLIMPYVHFMLINKMASTDYSLVLLSIVGNIGGLIWVKDIIKKITN
jgi:hypothetical protein